MIIRRGKPQNRADELLEIADSVLAKPK